MIGALNRGTYSLVLPKGGKAVSDLERSVISIELSLDLIGLVIDQLVF